MGKILPVKTSADKESMEIAEGGGSISECLLYLTSVEAKNDLGLKTEEQTGWNGTATSQVRLSRSSMSTHGLCGFIQRRFLNQ